MKKQSLTIGTLGIFLPLLGLGVIWNEADGQDPKKDFEKRDFGKKDFPFGFGGMGQTRQIVKQFDKDGDGRLNLEERKAAREFLKKERAAGGGFPGKGPGGKGKGGFGPGLFLTKTLLDALAADADEGLTKAEWIAGVKKFFAEADKSNKGYLTEASLAEGLTRILPQPKGFPGGPKEPGPKDDPKGGPKGDFKGGPFGGFNLGNQLAVVISKRADADKDGKLTLDEIVSAAEILFKDSDKGKKGKLDQVALTAAINQLFPPPQGGFGPGGFGGKGKNEPGKPGPRVSPAEVINYPKEDLYDATILRTLFLDFENKDWEEELADFHGTDVEVPATLIVDGKKYPNVGVHFRGMSSYMMVPAGSKRSLNVSLDFVDAKQRLHGHKTLNLLNSHDDPTFMHTVLFSEVARNFIPAPKANFVKVVINGESWGVYTNAEQFNKEFLAENFKSPRGARWKIKGSPGGRGGLEYIGDKVEDYKRIYTIKSKEDPKDWQALITLCKTLSQTPLDQLEEALRPMLDLDGVLWFLALDNALMNDDGYWIRASDYNLCRDQKGKFHVIPHDVNETFQPMGMFGFGPPGGKGPKGGGFPGGGKGFPGGPGGGMISRPQGVELDPLIGLEDARKPLRGRLLMVPSLRAQYLKNVRTIAEDWLDWKKLGPMVERNRRVIEKEIAIDSRKLTSLALFQRVTADAPEAEKGPAGPMSLRSFADQRRAYLLKVLADKQPQ